jgi:hypothetical protein
MKDTFYNRLLGRTDGREQGTTLSEVMVVMAITTIVLTLILVVTNSIAKHDARNLARQARAEDIRSVSLWLSEALAYAAPPPGTSSSQVFTTAESHKVVFTSALGAGTSVGGGTTKQVSQVTLVVGELCWGAGAPLSEAGVLRRCVQEPIVGASGGLAFCTKGDSGCPDSLFDEFIVARNVKDQPIFSYSVGSGVDPTVPRPTSVSSADLERISAIEMTVTVAGEPGSGNEDVEATVVERHRVQGWEQL